MKSSYTGTGYNASNTSEAIGRNKNEKPIHALSILSRTRAGYDSDAHFSYSKRKITTVRTDKVSSRLYQVDI